MTITTTPTRGRLLADLCFLLAALCWAWAAPLSHSLICEDPRAVFSLRGSWASIPLLALNFYVDPQGAREILSLSATGRMFWMAMKFVFQDRSPENLEAFWELAASFGYSLSMALFVVIIQRSMQGIVAVMIYLCVPLAASLTYDHFMKGEKNGTAAWAAVIVVVLGIAYFAADSFSTEGIGTYLIAVGGAGSYALFKIASNELRAEQVLRCYGRAMLPHVGIAAAYLLVLYPDEIPPTVRAWTLLALFGIVATAIPLFLFWRGLSFKTQTLSSAVITTFVQPFAAGWLMYFVHEQEPSPETLIVSSLMLAAAVNHKVWSIIDMKRKERAKIEAMEAVSETV